MNKTSTTKYRVMREDRQGDDLTLTSEVWTGTSIDGLSRLYPPSNVFGADKLGHSEIEDGMLRTSYRFERQLEDGTWEKIADPRRRITPMTATERAVYADNRRDFPGDFVTSDSCEQCADEGCDACYRCKACDDRGCQLCDPYSKPVCSNCDDFGCQRCEPYCIACNNRSVSKDGDVCSDCEQWANTPLCLTCTKPTILVGATEEHNSICMECADFYDIYRDCWQLFAAAMLGLTPNTGDWFGLDGHDTDDPASFQDYQ